MPTLNSLAAQSRQIAELANRTRDCLVKSSTVRHFLENPGLGETLLKSANGLKSKVIILYGLKESLSTKIAELERQGQVVDAIAVDILPSQQELMGTRDQNWLNAGDIVGGWIGYLADRPRVINDQLINGYRWHFLGDDIVKHPDLVKGPGLGFNKTDKWLGGYGWVKLTGTDVDSIHAEQADEIESLTTQLEYFEQRQYLKAT